MTPFTQYKWEKKCTKWAWMMVNTTTNKPIHIQEVPWAAYTRRNNDTTACVLNKL